MNTLTKGSSDINKRAIGPFLRDKDGAGSWNGNKKAGHKTGPQGVLGGRG